MADPQRKLDEVEQNLLDAQAESDNFYSQLLAPPVAEPLAPPSGVFEGFGQALSKTASGVENYLGQQAAPAGRFIGDTIISAGTGSPTAIGAALGTGVGAAAGGIGAVPGAFVGGGIGSVVSYLTDQYAGNKLRETAGIEPASPLGSLVNATVPMAGLGAKVAAPALKRALPEVVETVSKYAPKFIGEGLESAGNAVAQGLDTVGNFLSPVNASSLQTGKVAATRAAMNSPEGSALTKMVDLTDGPAGAPLKAAQENGILTPLGAKQMQSAQSAYIDRPIEGTLARTGATNLDAARVAKTKATADAMGLGNMNTLAADGTNLRFEKEVPNVIDDPLFNAAQAGVVDQSALLQQVGERINAVQTDLTNFVEEFGGLPVPQESIVAKLDSLLASNAKDLRSNSPQLRQIAEEVASEIGAVKSAYEAKPATIEAAAQLATDISQGLKAVSDLTAAGIGNAATQGSGLQRTAGDRAYRMLATTLDEIRGVVDSAASSTGGTPYTDLTKKYSGYNAFRDGLAKVANTGEAGMASAASTRAVGGNISNVITNEPISKQLLDRVFPNEDALVARTRVLDQPAARVDAMQSMNQAIGDRSSAPSFANLGQNFAERAYNKVAGSAPATTAATAAKFGTASTATRYGADALVGEAQAEAPDSQRDIQDKLAKVINRPEVIRERQKELNTVSPEVADAQAMFMLMPGQINPYPKGLPRALNGVDPTVFLDQFMMRAQNSGDPLLMNNARFLGDKYRRTLAANDQVMLRDVVEGMTEAFPQFFEPGYGAGGKISNPATQMTYMKRLDQQATKGEIDYTFVAKQSSSLNKTQELLPHPLFKPQSIRRVDTGSTKRIEKPNGTYDYSEN